MSAISYFGRHLHFNHETMPGENHSSKMRGELFALQCGCPTVLFIRWGDSIYIIDPAMMADAKMKLPRGVTLGTIEKALCQEHNRQPFLERELLDFQLRTRKVVINLRRRHNRKKGK